MIMNVHSFFIISFLLLLLLQLNYAFHFPVYSLMSLCILAYVCVYVGTYVQKERRKEKENLLSTPRESQTHMYLLHKYNSYDMKKRRRRR